MARVLYLDCFSGIAGDMLIGALLDAGLPFDALKGALGSLMLPGFDVTATPVRRAGIAATKFDVLEHGARPDGVLAAAPAAVGEGRGRFTHEHGGSSHAHDTAYAHRTLAEIHTLVDRSALSPAGRDRAKALFTRLGEVEAAVHDTPLAQVHLHEVGAVDSIIDVVGAVFGLEWAGADRIVCSPLNVGGGMVETAHGTFPVPAPATVRLLHGVPIYSGRVQKELVTPTGALLATAYATGFGPMPAMQIERVGYGAGTRDNPATPNVLRVLIGEAREAAAGDRVVVLEAQIDDMNPQLFGSAMERLYAAGALDVFYVPVQMKKNRPGTLLTVIAPPPLREALAAVIFTETTTIGVRYTEMDRETLHRESVEVQTPVGVVHFKVARRGGRVVNAMPEFEDCVALAAAQGLSVKDVQALALQAYGARPDAPGKSS